MNLLSLPPVKSLFVTGTDTGVGKTIVSAQLANQAIRAGKSVCVYKPVQTGSAGIADDLTAIQKWCDAGVATHNTYCFEIPAAPWVSDCYGEELPPLPWGEGTPKGGVRGSDLQVPPHPAFGHLLPEGEGVLPAKLLKVSTIDLAVIQQDFERLAAAYDVVIVEGAGGVRVPLTADKDMRDLMILLGLPVVVVARPDLGTINHTLLTVESLQAVGLAVEGVIVSGFTPPPNSTPPPNPLPQGEGEQIPVNQAAAVLTLPEVFAQWLSVPVWYLPVMS